MSLDRLRKYVEEDEIYQKYKLGVFPESDFDEFCINHCKDIEELLDAFDKTFRAIEDEGQDEELKLQKKRANAAIIAALTMKREYEAGFIDSDEEFNASIDRIIEILRGNRDLIL